MPTVNISRSQKDKVSTAIKIVNNKTGTKVSQAQVIEMGLSLIIEKYEVL